MYPAQGLLYFLGHHKIYLCERVSSQRAGEGEANL